MVKEFTVGVRHLVNLGNFENILVEANVIVMCEDEDWETMRQQAQTALTTLLNDSFQAQKKPHWFEQIPAKRARG